jgi:hypothetical protein
MRNISFSSNSSHSVVCDDSSVQGVTSILNDTQGMDVAKLMVERFEYLCLGQASLPLGQSSVPVKGNQGLPDDDHPDSSQNEFAVKEPGLLILRQHAIVKACTPGEKREEKKGDLPGKHRSDNSQDQLDGENRDPVIPQDLSRIEIPNSEKKDEASVTVYKRAGVPLGEPQPGLIARTRTSCQNFFQRCFGRAPR